MGLLSSPRIYLQITPERIIAREVYTGKSATEMDTSAFRHPRSLISDFNKAREVLGSVISEVTPKSALIRPVLIIHWMPTLEGGFSPVEARVLKELGEAATARKVYLCNLPSALSDSEVRKIDV